MQEQEVGDGTNFVIILAGALLEQAEYLLKMVSVFNHLLLLMINLFNDIIFIFKGLTPVEVCEGFQIALEEALKILPTLTCHEIKDVKNNAEEHVIMQAVRSSIMSKQYGTEQFITDLVLKACSKYYF